MTTKITLDRIKKWKNALKPEEIDWLIDQVEKYEKGFWGKMAARVTIERNALQKENVRLREALKEIKFQASLVETSDNVLEAIEQAMEGEVST